MPNLAALRAAVFYAICEKTDRETFVPPAVRGLINPISGRLLATPISGKGGLFRTPPPPLEISGSYWSICKIQTAFVSPQHDLHFLKKKFQKFVEGVLGGQKTMNFKYFFDHVLPARL